MSDDAGDISDAGERVVASVKDWNYFAHLSVYRFAAPFFAGRRIIDAGSGTGYGTSYLRAQGAAEVLGLDISAKAVAYASTHFAGDGVRFQQADLAQAIPVETGSMDGIFSSQAMEHLDDIECFYRECRRVLRPGGVMVIAVPAITSPAQLEENIWNRYHITNLTPLGWYAKTARFFRRVTAYRHWPLAPYDDWGAIRAGLAHSAAETSIREDGFVYEPCPIQRLNTDANTLNTVLIARAPRRWVGRPHVDEFVPHSWKEGAVQARVRREETELLRWKLWCAEKK